MRPALRWIHVAGAAAALLLAAASRVAAQDAVLALKVAAAETQAPLPGAQVKVDSRNAAVTDAQGAARVSVRTGSHRVEVRAIGRRAFADRVEVTAGETHSLEVALAVEAVPLDPVTATADAAPMRSPMLQAFYDRVANHTNGRLYTRAYIERRKPQRVTDLLMDGTGLKWNQTRGGHRRLRFRRGFSGGGGAGSRLTANSSPTTAGFTTGDCPPKYYLNGTPLDVDHVSENDPSPDLFVHIDEVEGGGGVRRHPAHPVRRAGRLVRSDPDLAARGCRPGDARTSITATAAVRNGR